MRKLLVSLMAVISIGSAGAIGSVLTSGNASAATQTVAVSPGRMVAGQPATVNINYDNHGASLVVWVSGMTVSSWAGCRSTTVNRQTYEICSPSFSFSTLAAPAAPTSSNAYPLTVALYNGYSRGGISYSGKAVLTYLGDYYN